MMPERVPADGTGGVRPVFEDGLGRRYTPAARFDRDTSLEILCFRHEITDVPAFEFALRERFARLSDFEHPCFVRLRKIDRHNDERGTVTLMADGAAGDRLIEILSTVERTGLVFDVNSALYLVRQLIAAIAALHQHTRVAHGAIAPERLFVTPQERLLIVEYSLGAAIEQLKYSRERYWKELRVAVPAEAGRARFDERTDLTQIGMVALALLLGRPLRDEEYPQQAEELVGAARARATNGANEPLPSALRDWLRRALQLDARHPFRSVLDAQAAFDQVLLGLTKYNASVGTLHAFMAKYHAAASATPASGPASVTPDTLDEPDEAYATYEPLQLPEADSSHTSDEGKLQDEEGAMRSAFSGKRRSGRLKWIAAAILVASATTFAARQRISSAVVPVTTGMMTVNTDPPGAEVEIDGAGRGRSPIRLELSAGAHTLVIRGHGESRTIPVSIAAGAEISQYLELPKASSGLGQLRVRTEPAGARISIDGTPLGKTPMTIVEIAPGDHVITLESDSGSVTQTVKIEAGVPASLVVPMAAAAASGWISVKAPIVVDLQENGRLLGNSQVDKIMLPAGKHEVELVNEHLGYREVRTVQVSPGRTAAISVVLPKGTVSFNAIPWASVFIDGESIGDTPIGNVPLTVGPHEVVFRNPELGEQRRIVSVTTRAPVRLSVDLTRK